MSKEEFKGQMRAAEIGSIEGYLQGFVRGGSNRRVAYVVERITGELVRCLVSPAAARELEAREIREWRYPRVEVSGTIHFAGSSAIDHVEADQIRFLRNRTDLPQLDDIIDPEFTGGVRIEYYLAKLRDGPRP